MLNKKNLILKEDLNKFKKNAQYVKSNKDTNEMTMAPLSEKEVIIQEVSKTLLKHTWKRKRSNKLQRKKNKETSGTRRLIRPLRLKN